MEEVEETTEETTEETVSETAFCTASVVTVSSVVSSVDIEAVWNFHYWAVSKNFYLLTIDALRAVFVVEVLAVPHRLSIIVQCDRSYLAYFSYLLSVLTIYEHIDFVH
jgi:hypothetical protein